MVFNCIIRWTNTDSQRTKSGTFARHTHPTHKANLAKEPALFPRFLDTPCFGGHMDYSDTRKKGERTTWVFMQVWQDVINWAEEYHGINKISISSSAANTTPA